MGCGSRSVRGSAQKQFAGWGQDTRAPGKGMSPGGGYIASLVWLAAGRSRGSGCALGDCWEARNEQDAPGPRPARVRVCARWGGAWRVHGAGGTRASAVAELRCNTRPAPPSENTAQNPGSGAARGRLGEPSGRARSGPHPAAERANAVSQHP